MKPSLTLPAFKLMVRTPACRAELKGMRQSLIRMREEKQAEFDSYIRQADKVIHDMGVALGEVEA